jgi:gluconate 2-dehydrogenase gamma chain
MNLTRRDWILGSLGVAAWSAIADAQQHAHRIITSSGTATFEYLDPASAQDVSAIAAQIIPSDDGPGAAEAGAVYFIDRALKTFAAGQQGAYREGLADLNQRRRKTFPQSASFSALSGQQQQELLRDIQTTPFFALLRTHTVFAWLGPKEYGGNRNGVGWKYIGFDDAGFFEPPFGYYDAEAK